MRTVKALSVALGLVAAFVMGAGDPTRPGLGASAVQGPIAGILARTWLIRSRFTPYRHRPHPSVSSPGRTIQIGMCR